MRNHFILAEARLPGRRRPRRVASGFPLSLRNKKRHRPKSMAFSLLLTQPALPAA